MSRRQAAHRRPKKNKYSVVLISMVVILISIAVSVKSIELKHRVEEYSVIEAQLEAEIAAEQARSEDLAEYEKYTHTKKYIEDVAKEKLGLVYEGEIVFKEEAK